MACVDASSAPEEATLLHGEPAQATLCCDSWGTP